MLSPQGNIARQAAFWALLLLPFACKRTGEEDLRKGNVYFTHRQWPEAKAHFEAALVTAPDNTHAMEALGNVAYEEGQTEVAIGWYRKALAADENAISARHKLAVVLGALGRTDEAIPILEGTILRAPNDAFAFFSLAGVLQKQGHLPKAEGLYRQALAIDETHHAARYALANLEIDDGRQGEAERELERLVRDGQTALADYGWARLAAKRGDVPTAARYLSRLLEAGVPHPERILEDPLFSPLWGTEAFSAIKSRLEAAKASTSTIGAGR